LPERDRTLAFALAGFHAALPGERRTEDPDAAARLRALGYVSGSAPAKARYTAADDPKRLVDLDKAVHDAVEAFGAGRAGDAVRIYQRLIAARPDMAMAYRHLRVRGLQRGDRGGGGRCAEASRECGPYRAAAAGTAGWLSDRNRPRG